MAWKKLSERLQSLPLVLSGPLLRRVDANSTTVWLATIDPCKVTLRVYETDTNASHRDLRQEGTRNTMRLGDHLHVVAITAKGALNWGKLHLYDLRFAVRTSDDDITPIPVSSGSGLFDPDILADTPDKAKKLLLYSTDEVTVGMIPPDLPSFVTPPTDLNKLHIIHGSCRKPHGPSNDALQILDNLIRNSVTNLDERPQQLYLTGDQIYADDVADSLLAMLT